MDRILNAKPTCIALEEISIHAFFHYPVAVDL
ncbi:hypothetical protein DEVEQU_02025 [Devosia equisanguinis]|uniref:Uncharacterized protein n=1 Tax=Devosia equisanguinis TaxID=2490941 RepID=A0A447IBU1_9HYPH|nr:hypothetical protein DEVEQU_02025 [Devosia equisanguinis]